ncbi:hypothetical protein CAEBREN_22765 [Caenorhabditis brenneri]|uniref:Uncharacterized protein n=1 Tax=Caenorhabditis brenneri TaxID=135651 RepID=G0NQ16_CAEBE|nr:hypothetical protein CAEBREN_19067 [Caenorhabditis brenneri]EGT35472.1 hypothetical protein CAEBREN_22765 [Caenorhabditis brenneri]
MKLFCIFVLIACSAFVSCDDTEDLEPMTVEPRDPARDAADLELAKTVATKFAADLMKVRKSEDIHDLTNNLMDTLVFNMCDNRLYKAHFVAFSTHALIEEEKYPTDLTLEPTSAYTRGNDLSMLAKASGFVFEANDEVILDFKKQEDGSYKLSQGTIVTCKYE